MAINSSTLGASIKSRLESKGFKMIEFNGAMAEAIAEAVVEHFQQNAQVIVSGGSSAGTYQVK
ncbi:hypothetical protein [Sulfurimonas sp.]|uniref:hypothetical protein n=1 Tax=Sulfurimonas sp. TaxID=2022749 RepID=UPI002B47D3A8|nr:hypothetical protein [Sulfurimonas sp.]